jgi:hypothetical protein
MVMTYEDSNNNRMKVIIFVAADCKSKTKWTMNAVRLQVKNSMRQVLPWIFRGKDLV